MTYYDGKRMRYLVDGEERWMTEESAEEYQAKNPTKDVQADLQRDDPLPEEAGDDYIDCSCLPDPPNGTAELCPACKLYFQNLEDD